MQGRDSDFQVIEASRAEKMREQLRVDFGNEAAGRDVGRTQRFAGLHDLPMHSINPLDILSRGSATLFSDATFICEGLISVSGGNSQYFEQRSREWIRSLLLALVLRDGSVSFPSLMGVINAIEGDTDHWISFLEFMLACPNDDVRRTASEMLQKQQEAEREFGAIMGSIYAALSSFNDPLLQDALSAPDFSLADLCDPKQVTNVFLNVPIEYVGIWSPLLRTIFTVAMLYKGRRPDSPAIHLIADEAGQLGKAEFLLRAFTFGRGAGIRAWAVFQDIGQIKRNFGAEALQGFIGSAQTRIFFGVRDLETAEYVSRMLGDQTLEFDNELPLGEAQRKKKQLVRDLMAGANPMDRVHEYKQLKESTVYRSKQTRRLMTPSEVLAMPEDRMIAFVSGMNLDPLYLHKRPYFDEKAMAGHFLPNPYHAPTDRVRIQTRFGKRWHKIISEPVPKAFSHYPQHQDGYWRYVESYKTK